MENNIEGTHVRRPRERRGADASAHGALRVGRSGMDVEYLYILGE